jgi:hypothetical protein
MENKPSYWREPILAFGRMSSWILGPILLALFLGKWLDQKFGTAPLLFASTMGIAFLLSSFGIVKEARKYISKITKEDLEKKDGTDTTNNAN